MSERKISPRQALFRHTILILASFVMIYPLLWMVMSSFKPDTLIFSDPMALPETIGFDNYVNGWNALAVSFTTFYKNSFFIAIMAVIGNVMACSLTAYAFARLEFRGRRIWFALMMGTLMLPYHVTLVPQYVLFLNIGWVNTFLPLIVPKFLAVDAFFIYLQLHLDLRRLPRPADLSQQHGVLHGAAGAQGLHRLLGRAEPLRRDVRHVDAVAGAGLHRLPRVSEAPDPRRGHGCAEEVTMAGQSFAVAGAGGPPTPRARPPEFPA